MGYSGPEYQQQQTVAHVAQEPTVEAAVFQHVWIPVIGVFATALASAVVGLLAHRRRKRDNKKR